MSLAAASHAAALCRPTVSGTSRSRPAAFASCEQHRGRLDAPESRRSRPRRPSGSRGGAGADRAPPSPERTWGDPEWFANQALAAGVILAGFVATGGLEELGLGSSPSDGSEDGRGSRAATARARGGRSASARDGATTARVAPAVDTPACPSARRAAGGRQAGGDLEIPVETEEQTKEQLRQRDEQRRFVNGSRRFVNGSSRGFKLPGVAVHASTTLEPDSPPRQAPPPPTPPRERKSGGAGSNGSNGDDDPASSKDDDFYAQSGEAIRTLREDYPDLLDRQLTWGIYRDDVGLVDNTVRARPRARRGERHRRVQADAQMAEDGGIHSLLARGGVNVVRIWSPLGSSGVRTIKVRWSIHALRLVGNLTEDCHFDGISEYKLDRAGFIYQHSFTDPGLGRGTDEG